MLPIGQLMIEHRLIEKMVNLLLFELDRLKSGGRIDPEFNRIAADFFRVYADKVHHGKEENILFRELGGKDLSAEHKGILEQLVSEHAEARKRVKGLADADSEEDVIRNLEFLTELYPRHIETEDKNFFIPVMEYFTDSEKEKMILEGKEFDRSMIHEKYKSVIEEIGKRRGA